MPDVEVQVSKRAYIQDKSERVSKWLIDKGLILARPREFKNERKFARRLDENRVIRNGVIGVLNNIQAPNGRNYYVGWIEISNDTQWTFHVYGAIWVDESKRMVADLKAEFGTDIVIVLEDQLNLTEDIPTEQSSLNGCAIPIVVVLVMIISAVMVILI